MLQVGLVSIACGGSVLKGAAVRTEVEAQFAVKTSSRVFLPPCVLLLLSEVKTNTWKGKHGSAEAGAQPFLAKGKMMKLLLFSLFCSLQRLGYVFTNVVYSTLSHK